MKEIIDTNMISSNPHLRQKKDRASRNKLRRLFLRLKKSK